MNLTVYFYSAGLQALLAEGIVDFDIVKGKVTSHPLNPKLGWQMLCIHQKVSKCKSDTTCPK